MTPVIRHALLALVCLSAALAAQPRRIVSTAPSITETVFALGVGDRLVGVTDYCNYPPAAQKITRIGNYLQPHAETILALRPDLVIAEDSPLHTKDLFSSLGLTVLKVKFETISDIYLAIRAIANALGVPSRGDALIASITRDLDAVRTSVAGRPPTSVMFLVGRTPDVLEGMVATGNAPYLNEVMQIAGGNNVFRDSLMRYFRVSQEQVIARNPQVILDMGDMAETVGVTEAHKRSVVALWNGMPALQAVQKHRVFAIASDIYVVPGPRVVECARAFARMFHPEAAR